VFLFWHLLLLGLGLGWSSVKSNMRKKLGPDVQPRILRRCSAPGSGAISFS
jgi:hypothetical protein